LPLINKGDTVNISFTTYPDLKLREPIYRTSNIINPANRTFEIEIRSKNIDNKLKPNMIATIRINDYTKDSALIVPSIIIKKDFEKQFIFLAEKNDTTTIARKIFVETGRSYKDKTIITKGIKIGDKVIVKGYNIVSNGSEISISN
jgi:multidrug efflux pump subunit AcrA (membrane-fusion protein)